MFFVQLCVEILVHVNRIGGEKKDTHGHDRTCSLLGARFCDLNENVFV